MFYPLSVLLEVRDYPPPIHEINAGFAVIANTTAGHAFLDALLEKMHYRAPQPTPFRYD